MNRAVVLGHDGPGRLRSPGGARHLLVEQVRCRRVMDRPDELLLLLGQVSREVLRAVRTHPDTSVRNFDVREKRIHGGTPPLHLGDVPELGSFSTHRPADRPHRRGLLAILLALYVIHAPQPAPRSRASVAPVYPPAARASVSTTAMFGNSAWGTPCRSFRYAGLL